MDMIIYEIANVGLTLLLIVAILVVLFYFKEKGDI